MVRSLSGKHAQTDTAQEVADLKWMLAQGYSVNLYMFHGGTTFGLMNGANFDDGYKPQTTSYDYAAALDESGRPTKKYFEFRDAIAAHDPTTMLPDVPQTAPLISIPAFTLGETSALWDNLGRPIEANTPRSMEMLGQSYGCILYQTEVAGSIDGELRLEGMHDYAKVYLNRAEQGTLDTRLGQNTLTLRSSATRNSLEILVENGGRINFTKRLRDQRKGITAPVTLAGKELHSWRIYPLPMNDPHSMAFKPTETEVHGPTFLRGSFLLAKTFDTFLDMRGLTKGVAWVNGHLLGRFWNIGPQETLFVPAPSLQVGSNEVVIFTLSETKNPTLRGIPFPVLGR